VVGKYNGAVADGNTLKVGIIRVGLAERLGGGEVVSAGNGFAASSVGPRLERAPQSSGVSTRELLPSAGKRYVFCGCS
jgi:hypothetical protein